MANALDTFREQRAAAGEVYRALKVTSELLHGMQSQVNALKQIEDLRALLQQESGWLREAERVVADVRRLREEEMRRHRPATIRRWALALAFALASTAAAGAGYAWVTRPYQAELATLRSRLDFTEYIEHRAMTMTPLERQQFDTLMRWNTSAKR